MLSLLWGIGILAASLLQIHPADTVKILPNVGYFLEMNQMDCVGNPEHFADLHCRIMPPLNRTMEASATILQGLTNGFAASLRVSIPKNRIITQIFEITFDVCKVLRERKRKMLIDLMVNTLAKSMNSKVLRCPFSKGKFESKNITVTDLPPMLRESDFLAHLDFFIPKVTILLNVTLQGHLYENAKEKARRKKYL
ncbi:hypothetical protein KR009_002572 [Drosophila setifemur]|nr:hypothetical protein KR009_002572 [Drosophila setifemur]